MIHMYFTHKDASTKSILRQLLFFWICKKEEIFYYKEKFQRFLKLLTILYVQANVSMDEEIKLQQCK